MKKILVLLGIVACAGFSAAAQQNSQSRFVEVKIVPTKMSWDYAVGENIRMEVSILKDELPLQNVSFRWEAGPDMMPAIISREASTGRGSVTLDLGKMARPGFFTLNVSVEVDGRRYDQWKTVGVDRDAIRPTVKMPDDFKAYWDAQRAMDDRMPLMPEMRLLPERCTPTVDVYEVSYAYTRAGGRMYGILCVPKAEGKYPAILNVPGAGIRPYGGSVGTAERGYIVLDIGIHGIPVTLDQGVYDDLSRGALTDYWSLGMQSRDTYYYNKVYRGARRGVDFIFSLPCFNGNIGVSGGSQGGALAVVVGALDSRVKCISSFYPALSDLTGYLHGRAGGWPHMLRNPESNIYNDPQYIETLSYYDVANFARILQVPAFFSMGYNDKVCPPTTTFAVYNSVTAPKEVMVVPQTAHWQFGEQNMVAAEFQDGHLKND